jgi:hypothetical protein
VIRMLLRDGHCIESTEAVMANVENGFVVCRNQEARPVLRIEEGRVSAYGQLVIEPDASCEAYLKDTSA